MHLKKKAINPTSTYPIAGEATRAAGAAPPFPPVLAPNRINARAPRSSRHGRSPAQRLLHLLELRVVVASLSSSLSSARVMSALTAAVG